MKRILSGILALGTMAVLFGSTAARAGERPAVRQADYDGHDYRDYGRYREYRERQERRERERRAWHRFRARHRYDYGRW